MNRPSPDEQTRVQEHPEDFSARTRNDVADQQVSEPRYFCPDHGSDRREDRILADMRGKALAAREEPQVAEHPESVGVRDASQKLSQLVWRARGGETILITINGVESAQLCPVVPRIDAKGEA